MTKPGLTSELLLVIDVEATCDDRGAVPADETEIIEIGAVLVATHGLEVQGEFQSLVRPVRHPILTDFCRRLTTIEQGEVDAAPLFPDVLSALCASLPNGPAGVLFCSWGDYDKTQITRDCTYHQTHYPFGDEHWNLKKAFAKAVGRRPCGMAEALRSVGLDLVGTHHRGLDDARNIAHLLRFVG